MTSASVLFQYFYHVKIEVESDTLQDTVCYYQTSRIKYHYISLQQLNS